MNAVLRISLPLTLWLASFSAIYALHGLMCSSRWTPFAENGTGRAILIAAAVAALALQAALLFALRSKRWASTDRVMQRISLILAAVAFVATIWTLMPTAVTSHCL